MTCTINDLVLRIERSRDSLQILRNLDLSDKLVKSPIDPSEFGIEYKPCLTIKGQVFVDFVAKLLGLE